MTSGLLVVAVLAAVSIQSYSAAKAPDCLRRCKNQEAGCNSGCTNFIFGPDICQTICKSWGSRCRDGCPEAPVKSVPSSRKRPGTSFISAPAASNTPTGNAPSCGRSNSNRIVGGTTAGRCEYPWMVLIYNQLNHKICGGSIVGPRRILTAGHCLFSLNEGTRSYEKARANHLIVFSGASDMPLGGHFASEGLRRNYVLEVVTHPNYNPSNAKNDIAMLKLRTDLPSNDCHVPICLVTGNEDPQTARSCRTMGWGKTSNNPNAQASNRLNWAGVNIVDDAQCRRIYRSSASESTLCAGGNGKDSCSGDSGGPLVCRGANGAFFQYGVVSLGLQGQCGRIAGLYTRVANFLPWIKSQLA